jgi:hypothetical protein
MCVSKMYRKQMNGPPVITEKQAQHCMEVPSLTTTCFLRVNKQQELSTLSVYM